MSAAAQKAKGPASAATDPDHGSTIPCKEKRMNMHTDSTATAPKPDCEQPAWQEYHDLESQIGVAKSHASALGVLISHTLAKSDYRMGEEEAEAVCHLVFQTVSSLDHLFSEWNEGFERIRGRSA